MCEKPTSGNVKTLVLGLSSDEHAKLCVVKDLLFVFFAIRFTAKSYDVSNVVFNVSF